MFNEDLDAFLNESEFSTPITIEGITYQCIFNIENAPMAVGAEGREIVATIKTSDAVGIKHDAIVEVNSQSYIVIGVQPFDDGVFTDLILRE